MKRKGNIFLKSAVLALAVILLVGCSKLKIKGDNSQNKDYLPLAGKIFRSDEDGERILLTFKDDTTCLFGHYKVDYPGIYAQNKDYIFISRFAFGEPEGYKYTFDGKKLALTNSYNGVESYVYIGEVPEEVKSDKRSEKSAEVKKLVGKFELKPDEGDTSDLILVIKESLIYRFNEDGTCSYLNEDTKIEKQGIFLQADRFVFVCWNNSLKDIEACRIDEDNSLVLAKVQETEKYGRAIREVKLHRIP